LHQTANATQAAVDYGARTGARHPVAGSTTSEHTSGQQRVDKLRKPISFKVDIGEKRASRFLVPFHVSSAERCYEALDMAQWSA
jgi:hypothetical protein